MAEPPDMLRLLVISSDEECLSETEQALGPRAGHVDLRWASQPDLAPLRVSDFRPHLILVYDDIGAQPVVSVVRRLATVTDASIVAVVAQDGADLARRALLSGARGFLVRPLRAEQIASLLAEAAQGRSPPRRPPAEEAGAAGRIIVFCSPKGGTGRTTLAVNSAIAIHALTGQSVVLMDADYASPAVDVALDMHDAPDVSFLLPRLGKLDEEFLDAMLVTHDSGIRALLAPPPAEKSAPKTPADVDGVLAALCGVASWVVVDLGLPMDERARAFVTQANVVVVNVVPEAIGLRNAGRLLEWLWEQGISPEATRVVLNRADLRSGLRPAEVGKLLGIPIAFEIPDDQTLATASVNRGAPIVFDRRHTAVATAVRELSRRLVREMAGVDHVAERVRLPRRGWVVVGTTAAALVMVAGALFVAPARVGVPFPILAAGPDVPTQMAMASSAPVAEPAEDTDAIESPQAGATVANTPAPTATSTPLPTQTPLPTRTPAPTRTPSPTPTPPPIPLAAATELPPPRLLQPASGAVVSASESLVLSWSWDEELPDDGYFVVTLAYRHDGATRYVDVPWIQETTLDALLYVRPVSLAASGRFYWSVKVVRHSGTDAEGKPLATLLSPMSQVRTFVREGTDWSPGRGE